MNDCDGLCNEWCDEELRAICPSFEPKPAIEPEPEFLIDGVRIAPEAVAPDDPEFEQSILELFRND